VASIDAKNQSASTGTDDAYRALARQNRILIWLLFVSVVLLGPISVVAYFMGQLTVHSAPPAPLPSSAKVQPSDPPRGKAMIQPAHPTAAKETVQSAVHGIYLQLAATPFHQALISQLQQNGFEAVAL
jgi:hypothetical protein